MRWLIVLLALAAFSPITLAQKPPAPAKSEGLTREEIAAYRKSLHITAAQKNKIKLVEQKHATRVKPILARYQSEQEKLRKSKGGGTREQRSAIESKLMAEMKPLVAAYQKEVQAVYTPNQRKKMAAFQAHTKALLRKSLSKPSQKAR